MASFRVAAAARNGGRLIPAQKLVRKLEFGWIRAVRPTVMQRLPHTPAGRADVMSGKSAKAEF
jgi:hypothetical protein